MKKEISYGIVPLRKKKEWEVLIVKHQVGHWAFPKGHGEENEKAEESATRELYEECGLQIDKFLNLPPLQEEYIFRFKGALIQKTVIYFLAEVKGKIKIQEKEIEEAKWIPLIDAEKSMTFKEAKRLCRETIELLNKNI